MVAERRVDFSQLEGRGFAVSSDSSGVLLGHAGVLKKVWGFARRHERFMGVEAIAWGRGPTHLWTGFLLWQFARLGFRPLGLHGQIAAVGDLAGVREQALVYAVDRAAIMSTERQIKSYGNATDYLLIHSAEFRYKKSRNLFRENIDRINFVFVENEVEQGALYAAVTDARRIQQYAKAKGVENYCAKSGVMCDLFHLYEVYRYEESPQEAWLHALSDVSWLMEQRDISGKPLIVGFHFPIGTNKRDSLPLDEISDEMLYHFSAIIGNRPTFFVFENQQEKGLVYLSGGLAEEQAERNQAVFERVEGPLNLKHEVGA